MLRIKPDHALLAASDEVRTDPLDLALQLILALNLEDDDIDEYAGERLGKLFKDQPGRKALLQYFYPSDPDVFNDLTLLLEGALFPCSRCGWEMAPEEEGDYIVGYRCPHCGHTQLELPADA